VCRPFRREPPPQTDGCEHCPSGMVLKRLRYTDECEQAVPQKLVNRASVPLDLLDGDAKKAVEDLMYGLGSEALCHPGGVHDVAEEHRDGLVLAGFSVFPRF